MSIHADPNKATVYLDFDFYRAPSGTAVPADPFAANPVTGTAPGVTWDAFGGLQMGFDKTPARDVKKHRVANYRKAAYGVTTSPIDETFKLRATDRSKATFLTMLEGGSVVTITPGLYRYDKGEGEEFAVLGVAVDITAKIAFHCKRVRLGTPPPRSFKGEDLDGWEFELIAIDKIDDYGDKNPLSV